MVNMTEIRPNKRICVFSGSSRKYLTDSNILFFKIMLGTDHLIFWVGGVGRGVAVCFYLFVVVVFCFCFCFVFFLKNFFLFSSDRKPENFLLTV